MENEIFWDLSIRSQKFQKSQIPNSPVVSPKIERFLHQNSPICAFSQITNLKFWNFQYQNSSRSKPSKIAKRPAWAWTAAATSRGWRGGECIKFWKVFWIWNYLNFEVFAEKTFFKIKISHQKASSAARRRTRLGTTRIAVWAAMGRRRGGNLKI